MKKLILVTLTAFAASWLLSEVRRDDLSPTRKPPRLLPALVIHQGSDPSDEPGSIRIVTKKKRDGSRSKQAPAALSKTMKEAPAWFPKTEIEEESMAKTTDASGSRVIVGRVSASEERARQDLRLSVERAVADWLAADVPSSSWKVPPKVLDAMVQDSYTQEVLRNLIAPEAGSPAPETPGLEGLFTLYRAGQKLDFSEARKAEIVGLYRQDLATKRMHRLGGGLILALATLAVLSGYIKADEATKGYYTNRLRFVSAAGLGVAGVVVYRLMA